MTPDPFSSCVVGVRGLDTSLSLMHYSASAKGGAPVQRIDVQTPIKHYEPRPQRKLSAIARQIQ